MVCGRVLGRRLRSLVSERNYFHQKDNVLKWIGAEEGT